MPTGRCRRSAPASLLVALVLALGGLVAGCSHQADRQPVAQGQPGAGPTTTAPGYRTWFPHEHVRFQVGQQVRMRGVPDVLSGFIAFQVATAKALRTGRIPPALRRHATHDVVRLVRHQVDYFSSRGVHLAGHYRIGIREVQRAGTAYALQVCVRQRGQVVTSSGATEKAYRKRQPVGILLAQHNGTGLWRVTDYQAEKHPMKGC